MLLSEFTLIIPKVKGELFLATYCNPENICGTIMTSALYCIGIAKENSFKNVLLTIFAILYDSVLDLLGFVKSLCFYALRKARKLPSKHNAYLKFLLCIIDIFYAYKGHGYKMTLVLDFLQL